MSKNINPLDHVSNPLHSPADLIMKQVCPGPHPKKLGEVSLDKEVPIHKMCSPCTAQNHMVRGIPREEPTTTCAGKTPPVHGRDTWEFYWFVCCCFVQCDRQIHEDMRRLEERLKKKPTALRRFSTLFCKLNRTRLSKENKALSLGTKCKGAKILSNQDKVIFSYNI